MDLNLTISLNDEEIELLKDIFSCTHEDIPMYLEKLARASTIENLTMILGQKVFYRGQDIKEYKLYLLIKYFFDGKLPDEQMITTLFQTTLSESKSLLKSVLAKYQYDLKEAIKDTIKLILENEVEYEEQNDKYYVTKIAINTVDEMNKILSTLNGSLDQISKKRGSCQTFEITPSSYEALCIHYDINMEDEEDE